MSLFDTLKNNIFETPGMAAPVAVGTNPARSPDQEVKIFSLPSGIDTAISAEEVRGLTQKIMSECPALVAFSEAMDKLKDFIPDAALRVKAALATQSIDRNAVLTEKARAEQLLKQEAQLFAQASHERATAILAPLEARLTKLELEFEEVRARQVALGQQRDAMKLELQAGSKRISDAENRFAAIQDAAYVHIQAIVHNI